MQTIETRSIGPTNTRGRRIIAETSGGTAWRCKAPPVECNNELDEHAHAADALRKELGWGNMRHGGTTKRGNIWVFEDGPAPGGWHRLTDDTNTTKEGA